MSGATIANLIGASGPRANAGDGGTHQDQDLFGAGAATTTLVINSNGTATITGINLGLLAGWNWSSVPGAPTGWTVRVDVSAGTLDGSSAEATDLAVSSSRTWFVTRTDPGGTDSCTFTLTFKDSGGNVIDSAVYTLEALRP